MDIQSLVIGSMISFLCYKIYQYKTFNEDEVNSLKKTLAEAIKEINNLQNKVNNLESIMHLQRKIQN